MKKNLILTLFFALSTTFLGAQIRFGFKAGLSSTDLDVSQLMIDEPGLSNRLTLALEDANYGIQIGALARIYLGRSFILQPEVLFNSNTVEFGVDDLDDPSVSRRVFEESYQYVDIPLMLNWELAFLRFQAGPVGHVFLNSSSDLYDFQDYDQNFNDLTIGYLYGVGIDLWSITIDLRREGNFTKFGSHIRFGDTRFQFDEAPSRWLLTVGYVFGDRPR
ncbi:MAG TPA: outer membrane beta-barrel protein [Saprospiraceae bacterium]|nr:outer membrane beta-barrel protein [Saprospiraceae bacterium]